MPSLNSSQITLDPQRYKRHDPTDPIAPIQPVRDPVQSPQPPPYLQRSTILISSLPSISTDVDGIVRQFYGGRPLPMRRLILPG